MCGLCLFLAWWCLVVLCCLFGVLALFLFGCVTNCLTPILFTQKLWSSSRVSMKGHWTCAATHVLLRLEF